MNLCLGTVQFGLKYGIASKGRPDKTESFSIMKACLDNGVFVFDTAPAYGSAEEFIGEFTATYGVRRDMYKVATKTVSNCFSGVAVDDYYNIAKRNLITSLKSLRCDYVDYYLLHTSTDVFINEIVNAISKLKEEGMVKEVGVSIYNPSEAIAAVTNPRIDCIQIPYNVLDRRLDKASFFRQLNGRTLFARSVLLQGLLTMNSLELSGKMMQAAKCLDDYGRLCKKYGISKIAFAVNYVKSKNIDYMIIGVDSLWQLNEYFTLLKTSLPIEAIHEADTLFNEVDEFVLNPSMWNK